MKIFLFLFLLLPALATEGRIALLRESTPIQDKVIEGVAGLLEQHHQIRIWSVSDLDAQATDQKIKNFQPNLVITLGTKPLSYARKHLSNTPRVVGMILKKRDILHSDLETGIYLEFDPDVQLDYIKKILPNTQVVGMLYSPSENSELVEEIETAAVNRDLELITAEIYSPRDIPKGFRKLEGAVDILLGVFDSVVLTRETARPLISYSFQQKLPFMSVSQSWAKAGALLAIDRDYLAYGRQMGSMAQRILNGEKLSTISPNDPDNAILFFNRRTSELIKVFPQESTLDGVIIIDP